MQRELQYLTWLENWTWLELHRASRQPTRRWEKHLRIVRECRSGCVDYQRPTNHTTRVRARKADPVAAPGCPIARLFSSPISLFSVPGPPQRTRQNGIGLMPRLLAADAAARHRSDDVGQVGLLLLRG